MNDQEEQQRSIANAFGVDPDAPLTVFTHDTKVQLPPKSTPAPLPPKVTPAPLPPTVAKAGEQEGPHRSIHAAFDLAEDNV
jgi:hypothetical protein